MNFTSKQVATHDKKSDLYLIINGGVYNATEFANKHPGGPGLLIELAGKDATEKFNQVGHTDASIKILNQLKVGTISGSLGVFSTSTKVSAGAVKSTKDGSLILSKQFWLAVMAVPLTGSLLYYIINTST